MKRIALLVSLFCLVLGLFLLGYNLKLISDQAKWITLQLWPLVIISTGILLVADSLAKRRFTRSSMIEAKEFILPHAPEAQEILCRVHFSYGMMKLDASENGPILLSEQIGSMGEPTILEELRGGTSVLTVTMTQPMFPSYFQLLNTWHLRLPPSVPTRLELHLHEANLQMDLRRLSVENIDIRSGSGKQEILIGRLQKKLSAQIYSSSTELSIVLPSRTYAQVLLLNPFCRVDYPQGDFERREDGSLVSAAAGDSPGAFEVSIDGPIKNLVLDIEDADGTSAEKSET
jgi:hypothetical protein